jgi:hypothetical protein
MNDLAESKEAFLLDYCPAMKVMNCSSCGDLLVSEWGRERFPKDCRAVGVAVVWTKRKGKPYCRGCVVSGSVPAGGK